MPEKLKLFPFLEVGTLLGIWPYFKIGEDRKLWSKLYSFCAILLFGSVLIYFMVDVSVNWYKYQDFRSHEETDNYNQFIEISFCLLTSLCIMLLSLFKQGRKIEIIENISSLNGKISDYLGKTMPNEAKGCTLGYCLVVFGINGYVMGLSYFFKVHMLIYVIKNLQVFICGTMITISSAIIKIVLERLIFVNDTIVAVLKADYDEKNVKIISKSFEILYDIKFTSIMIDGCFGLMWLLYMAYFFYAITDECFAIFRAVTQDEVGTHEYRIILSGFLWISVQVGITLMLVTVCGNFRNEASKTAEILSRVYNKGSNYQKLIDKFLLKNLGDKTMFTAFGFFVIDNTTLFRIVCAVTTYLVILLQFKQLESGPETTTTVSPVAA